jgi:hypothetical protein
MPTLQREWKTALVPVSLILMVAVVLWWPYESGAVPGMETSLLTVRGVPWRTPRLTKSDETQSMTVSRFADFQQNGLERICRVSKACLTQSPCAAYPGRTAGSHFSLLASRIWRRSF